MGKSIISDGPHTVTVSLYNIQSKRCSLLTLGIFFSPERDLKKIRAGGDDSVQYEAVVGLEVKAEEDQEDSDNDSGDSSSAESEHSQEDGEESRKFVSSRRPKDEDKESKKLRKKAAQEDKAEKRKEKIKKHVKKRKEASGRRAIKK